MIVSSEPGKIFASTMLYAASKKLGLEAASNELMRQLSGLAQAGAATIADVDDVAWWGFPAALTLARVAICGEVKLHVNAGATVIGKGRSIAANEFLDDPRCAAWFAVDDDVVVSADAVAAMLERALSEECVVVAPCLQRGDDAVNIVEASPVVDLRNMQRIISGGFGAVCFSRAVIGNAMRGADKWNHDGKLYGALFRDEVEDGEWFTEDKAFFRHEPFIVRPGKHVEMLAPVYAVRRGFTTHAGQQLDLATLKPVAKVERTPLIV